MNGEGYGCEQVLARGHVYLYRTFDRDNVDCLKKVVVHERRDITVDKVRGVVGFDFERDLCLIGDDESTLCESDRELILIQSV